MSITTTLERLDVCRKDLADNLVTKGVQAAQTETLTQLVPKVLDITGGGGGSGRTELKLIGDPTNAVTLTPVTSGGIYPTVLRDSKGNLTIIDGRNKTTMPYVHFYDANGNFINKFRLRYTEAHGIYDKNDNLYIFYSSNTTPVYKYDVDLNETQLESFGSNIEGVTIPLITLDMNGDVIVAGYSNEIVKRYSHITGEATTLAPRGGYVPNTQGIAVDERNYLYINSGTGYVSKYTSDIDMVRFPVSGQGTKFIPRKGGGIYMFGTSSITMIDENDIVKEIASGGTGIRPDSICRGVNGDYYCVSRSHNIVYRIDIDNDQFNFVAVGAISIGASGRDRYSAGISGNNLFVTTGGTSGSGTGMRYYNIVVASKPATVDFTVPKLVSAYHFDGDAQEITKDINSEIPLTLNSPATGYLKWGEDLIYSNGKYVNS